MTDTVLLPQPSDIQWKDGSVAFPAHAVPGTPELQDLITAWLSDCGDLFDIDKRPQSSQSAPSRLVLSCSAPEEALPSFGDDESYGLDIDSEGIRLTAPTRTGIFYGLQTLLQLVRQQDDMLVFPHCSIRDEPRFPWRGLMLDVSRHFMPLDLVKRMIDAMAHVKLNVLHLGLSNNQGFRVESKRFPRLHKVASNGKFYSQEEIRELIAFAAERQVRIVPEFNMPGHSTAFILAYTELATGKPPEGLRTTSGVFDDEMNPASAHVTRFVRDFIGEMAALFPDEYWHFGGDEVTGKAWDADPTVQAYMKTNGLADNRALQAHFTADVLAVLKENGKKGIGWEEVVHGAPPKDTIIQPWMNPASDEIFAGYPLIASTSYYLDHFLWAEDYARIDPEAKGGSPNVIGAEACIWSEVMNADNVEAIIWPGALGLANLFWSPGDSADEASLRERITLAEARLENLRCADLDAPRRLAERLCGGRVPASIARLRDYVAPLVYYFVHDRTENPHDVTQPFSRLVETLLPETPALYRLEALVEEALDGDTAPLIGELTLLAGLADEFRMDVAALPGLQENQPVADALSEIAKSCLDVLEGGPASLALPLDALMPPTSNDLTGVLDAVSRRRKADLPMPLKETNIAILPALRRVLGSADQFAKPS